MFPLSNFLSAKYHTLVLGCTFSCFYIVFGVKPNLSPLLKNCIAAVSIPNMIVPSVVLTSIMKNPQIEYQCKEKNTKDTECLFSPDNVGPKGVICITYSYPETIILTSSIVWTHLHQHVLVLSLLIIEDEKNHGFSTGHIRKTYEEVKKGRTYKSKKEERKKYIL